jgi:hypothetical protein
MTSTASKRTAIIDEGNDNGVESDDENGDKDADDT